MSRFRKALHLTVATVLAAGCGLAVYALLCMNSTQELQNAGAGASPRPYIKPPALSGDVTQEVERYFPYPCAAAKPEAGTLLSQDAQDVRVGGEACRVVTRVYADEQDARYTLRSATPAAYMTAYSGYTPDGAVSASLGGMDALYMTREGEACLMARDGATVYVLQAQADADALARFAAAVVIE